jgi:NAD-dependent dihydropyrimidine dehydrogenase PreA subunit
MTFVITSPCIGTQDQACVDACPVDCIHFEEGPDQMLYINPDDCIDCGACQPACPVDAIYPQGDVPAAEARFIDINALWYTDPAAARAQVGGDAAPAAAPAAAASAPVAEETATPAAEAPATEAPAAETPAAEAPPTEEAAAEAPAPEPEPAPEELAPFRQVAASVDARSAAHPYRPSPLGVIALSLFAGVFFAMWVFPGPKAITIADLDVGITVLLGLPAALILGLLFLLSQAAALSRFAAARPRRLATWREGSLDWRRSEESRRTELTAIVQEIARDRFAYPNEEHPDFRTYVNLPEPQMAIQVQGGVEKLLPDIVVLDKPGGRPRLLAQVESKETLTREQAQYVWARLEMKDAPLLLYVPTGMAAQARDYVKAAGIKNARIRTWRRLPQGMQVRSLN